jgi:signal transduction histidine kinase
VRNELKYTCDVRTSLGPLPRLHCFPGRLNQVFANLLINASQAIADRGEITVATAVEGEEIVVRISDTGAGIPPEMRSRLFEPFVTTKRGGTGLGLSISQHIVREHGGTIAAASEPGRGTTFTIRLPREGVHHGDREHTVCR